MKSSRIIFSVFMIAAFAGSNAFASVLGVGPAKPEFQRLRWKSGTIRIAVSDSFMQPNFNIKTGSDVWAALSRSLETWQRVARIELQIETSDRQSVSPSVGNGDGVSLITIAQSPENVLLFSKNPFAESAKTRIFYNGKGFITEADIVLNPFQQFSTDGTFGTFDLESTLTHEIGHLLGLRHTGVLGATMSDALPKNGVMGFADLGPRTLAESDISAIRELYGASGDDDACCGAIAGKLSSNGRAVKNMRVWAEENQTGRIIAQVDVGNDGSFRLGGMPKGDYSLFWQKTDSPVTAVGEIDSVSLENGETRLLNEKIVMRRSDIALNYIGLNGQLVDSAIVLNAGREYMIYLGGRSIDASTVKIGFNSPFLSVSEASMAEQDFGEDIAVVSFLVAVDERTPAGVYSVFATHSDGTRAALIGALSVE